MRSLNKVLQNSRLTTLKIICE